MNRKTFKFTYRIAAALLLSSIFTFAFVLTRSSASKQVENGVQNQKTSTESKRNAAVESPEVATLKAEKRGFPLINLRDGKKFQTQFVGADGAAQSFNAAQARPLTMTNADLNDDGAGDLIVGYAGGNGGHLAYYQGSLDTLSARTPEIFEGMKEGRFPAPFLQEARLIKLPIAPDFIGTGDFNRDGSKDIIAAQRGSNELYLLTGNRRNSFMIERIEIPGRATAMLTENIDPLDNTADVAVAVAGDNGAALLVFNGAENAFGKSPEIYQLPAAATSLAVGQLDDAEPMDILAAGGGSTVIIHGAYPQNSGIQSGQVETLIQGFDVAAVRVGNFIWDRENRPEIGLLTADGSIHILERGKPDKRMFTEEEWKTRWRRHRDEAMEQDAVRKLDYQPSQGRIAWEKWTEADNIQIAAPLSANRASSASFFTSARMTPFGVEDLLVLDSVSRKLHVLVSNNDELKKTGESFVLSASGEHAVVTLDVEGTPVAALPMRLNVMNRPGIVLLDEESSEISYSPAAPDAIFNVTKTADTYDGACNADCSFREALQAANANMNSDIIMVPAGTYTINPALGGPDQDTVIDPAAQQSGDWDVFFDTTITGAGQATTILQAAAAQPGHDRVLDAIQSGVGFPDLTLSGLTLANGRCRADFPCVDGGGLRFAVDALAALTISDSTVTNSRTEVNTANPANNGGGIFGGQADYNFTNLTVTNNIAAFATGGCTNCGGEGGGAIIAFTNGANPTSLTMTNNTFTGNDARTATSFGGRGGALALSPNSVSITGGTFSNNIAGIDGGAFRIFTATTISGATINSNSAKQSGGGIWNDPLDNANNPLTNTFTNLTMRGNLADSNNAQVAAGGEVTRGDGGAIYHGRGVLNISGSTFGGTGAGQPNTAFNGGGIGHSYAQFLSAAFNASTINLNGGSVVGNLAINNGGGVLNDATRSASASANALNIGATTVVTFTNNDARNNGGGIAMLTNAGSPSPASSATLNTMTLRSNRANSDSSGGGDGGALHQDLQVGGGGTTFTGTTIIGGSGFANQAVNGGGIRNNAGTVTIPSGASIQSNAATGTGGGISNAGTLSALASATITNNTATGNGGGIFNSGTLGAITSPTLNSNSAATGGGIFSSSGALSITNGTANSNVANIGKGGGIEHSGSPASTVSSVTINNNTGSGILITGTGSLDATSNTITGNSGDGIGMTGTGVGSHFNSNVIHTNGELGIDLSDNGVTPNDVNDADTGPNALQNFPVINYVRRGDGVANFTLNAANGSYRIQFYSNTACDVSGFGEGEVLLASQTVTVAGNTFTGFSAPLAFGTREQITATATHDVNNNGNFDDDGNTSEFSACRKVNTLPTITPQAGNTRQQGSPVSNTQIAVVADPDQALNTLVVTVNGGASATVNGVTLSNIVVSALGFVTADIVASCTATNATFTLRVTDNATEFNEATLTVTVTANTTPTLGTYPNTLVTLNGGTTVTPSATPTDNGTFTLTVAASPNTLNDDLSINQTTGVVTITGAEPSGTFTVTVTSTDICGLTATSQFQVIVNAPPTITAQAGVSRQQGSPATNSQIATVNDPDQAANTLAVTVNGGASATVNGVTVTITAVSAAGFVTADVGASCTATAASFTLRVTDTNGAFNEATLNVAVTPNAAPTVGTYSNVSLAPGGGTTVTPTAAPADNGSIASATATAPGFTGTFTVNPTTGVVTIANANPPGTYTVTVTFTDNCGTPTTRQFTLTVAVPPTIAKSFTPTLIGVNGISTLTITITNPASNTVALTGVGVTDSFPTGLEVDATPGATNSCATGTFAPVAGATSITISGATIPVNTACTFTVKVKATTAGAKVNTTGNVTSTNGGTGATASATLTVSNSYEADVSPRPSGDTLIMPDDVVQIRKFLNGTDVADQTTDEFQRADSAPFASRGDGRILSDDVVQTRRYQNGTDPKQPASGPMTASLARPAIDSLVAELSQTDYENALVGNPREVRVEDASGSAGQMVTVNIGVNAVGNEAEYGFIINYDTNVLSNPVVGGGTAGASVRSCNIATVGQINCSVGGVPNNQVGSADGGIGELAAGNDQLLMTVQFTIGANAPPGTTPLTISNANASSDAAQLFTPTARNGTVTILAATAASITVSGRVLEANGRGVANARVELTDPSGNMRTARTNPLGYYQFTGVGAGETYVISVRHKQYEFARQVHLLNENRKNVNFVASP